MSSSPRLDPETANTSSESKDLQDQSSSDNNVSSATDDGAQKQSTVRTVLLLVSVLTSIFLVSLDRLIISTAIPKITDDFHSLPDVGWYGSAYLLASCSSQLLCGKLYTFYPLKISLLISVFLFEVGSLLCGVAPSSIAFIIGRAIAGVGSSAIFSGAIVSIAHTVPLEKRPKLMGLFGAVFGISSIVGPLIGGAFTSNLSWRWCFYINLPFGGVAMVVIFFCLKLDNQETSKLPWTGQLLQLDLPGTAALVPGVVSLLLALQWGGQTYTWHNWRIILLLTLMAVLLSAFVAIQILLPKTATIPPRIVKQRSMISGCLATVCIGASQYIFIYFLPIWFQSIDGSSAQDSGIRLLPLMLSMVLGTISGGFATSKIGYYTPFGMIGSVLMSIGAGLLTMLEVDTPAAKWIGYQIVYGFGMGWSFQIPNLAAQTVLSKKDVPVGTAFMFFSQLLGAAIFISVGENVLDNQLVQRLSGVPGFDHSLVTSGGATAIISSLPSSERDVVLGAYNESLRKVFQIGLIMAALSVPGYFTLEWRSVKKEEPAVETDKEIKEHQLESDKQAADSTNAEPKQHKDS